MVAGASSADSAVSPCSGEGDGGRGVDGEVWAGGRADGGGDIGGSQGSLGDVVTLVGRVVGMDLDVLTMRNAGAGVFVDAVDVSGLDDAALDLRLRLVGEARNRLDGFFARQA